MLYFTSIFIRFSKLFFVLFFLFEKQNCIAQDSTNTIQIISEIKIIGNKTTKAHIISRELPFAIQDTIS